MLAEQLTNKTQDLRLVTTELEYLHLNNETLTDDLNNKTWEIKELGRHIVEDYVGFSAKFKKDVDINLKDKVVGEVFHAKPKPISLVFNGDTLINMVDGHKEMVPLDEIFATVDQIVPQGELSLFKTTGLTTEFAVTTPEIAGAPAGKTGDVTRGGIYLKAETVGKPKVSVIPILHRLVCSNQMSKEEKDSALKVKGDSYDEILIDLSETIERYMTTTIPSQLNRWLGLTEYFPKEPERFAAYLMNRAKLGKKLTEKVEKEIYYSHFKLSAYDVINSITALQHEVTDAQRETLWRLGAFALTLDDDIITCHTCKATL